MANDSKKTNALENAKAKDPSLGKQKKAAEYTDDQVQHLDALEHIRLRSGMYIGRLGDGSNQNDGIYILLKEIIDNSVDEFIMGFGGRIDVTISPEEKRVTVRDYGRGIPLGKVVDCVSQINTGAKYNDDVPVLCRNERCRNESRERSLVLFSRRVGARRGVHGRCF